MIHATALILIDIRFEYRFKQSGLNERFMVIDSLLITFSAPTQVLTHTQSLVGLVLITVKAIPSNAEVVFL